MLHEAEFADNATRALGIEHTPFEANFGFSPEEPPSMMFNAQPSFPVSQGTSERFPLLHELHAKVRSVF
jgi:hypothetical protein